MRRLGLIVAAVVVLVLVVAGVEAARGSSPRGQHVAAAGRASEPTSTTASAPTSTSGPQTTVPLSSVDWSSVSYPVECGDRTTGRAVAYPQPAPGTDLAVVFVSCVAGAGSPPSAVLIYDSATSPTEPHLAQTLLAYKDNWSPQPAGTVATGPDLAIEAYGYSSADVPRCCPDLHPTLSWRWDGDSYVPVHGEPSHRELPGDHTSSPK